MRCAVLSRALIVGLALLPWPSSPGWAGEVGVACVGDCDGDGRVGVEELVRGVNIALRRLDLSICEAMDRNRDAQVGINELVAAVNNALDGCPCTFDFLDSRAGTDGACAYAGRWNSACGDGALPAVFSVQASLLGVALVTGPESPLLTFFAQPGDSHTANLVGFTYGDTTVPMGGVIELGADGRHLTIAPSDEVGISVRDCPFVRYEGVFVRLVSGSASD